MPDYRKDIYRLKDPDSIKNARLASSPYVLRKAFASDPTIQRLIKARFQVIPLIEKIIKKDGKRLPEISLAAYAYILEHVDTNAAVKILRSLFKTKVKDPGPFFVNFAAHAFRKAYDLPTKPLEMFYSKAELTETSEAFK